MLKQATFILILTTLSSTNLYGNESKMVLVPAGEFNIGASKKSVHLDKFYIDKTEVTQKEFKEIMGKTNFFLKAKITLPSK